MKEIKRKLMKLEYLNEVCTHSPALMIDTKCGVGCYKFSKLGYQDDQLIIEFKLQSNNKSKDTNNILHILGNKCYLSVDQFLYAMKYYASA
tara:strand:- start:908 stop:1180 length:273 start_codon:yes stop_codon:yes gene_type:complete